MHFIFYGYSADKFPEITKNLDTNNGLWWDVAEVFNSVVLSSQEFTQILGTEGDSGYPDHQDFIAKAKEIYRSSSDVSEFIKKLFKLLE